MGVFSALVLLIPYCFSYDGWQHASQVPAGAGCGVDVPVPEDVGCVYGDFIAVCEVRCEEGGAFYLLRCGLGEFEVSAEGYAYGVGVPSVGVGSYGAVGAASFYCSVLSYYVVVADSGPAQAFMGAVDFIGGYVGILQGACVVDYYGVCFSSRHVAVCFCVEEGFVYHELLHFVLLSLADSLLCRELYSSQVAQKAAGDAC